jgi:uncharacterized membrane protein
MSNANSAIIYAIFSFLGMGLSNPIIKKYVVHLGAAKSIFYRGLVVTFITGCFAFIFISKSKFDLYYFILGIIIAAVSYSGLHFFNRALETGKVGLVAPVNSTRILISIFVGVVFLEDRINVTNCLSIAIIFLGLIFISINFRELKKSNLLSIKSGVPYALISALFWGVTLPLFSIPAKHLGAFFYTFIVEIIVFAISLSILISQKKNLKLKKDELKKNFWGIILIGILSSIGSIFMNLGYATGLISIVAAIVGTNPLIGVLYGRIFYKEKLSILQYTSIIMIIIGIITLSIF